MKQIIIFMAMMLLLAPVVFGVSAETFWICEENNANDCVGDAAFVDQNQVTYSTTIKKEQDYAMSVDGTNDIQLDTGFATNTTNYLAFGGWFYPTDLDDDMHMFSIATASGRHNIRILTDDSLRLEAYATAYHTISQSVTGSGGSWIHVVVVLEEGSEALMYIDNTKYNDSSVIGNLEEPTGSVSIAGREDNNGEDWVGEIDDVRIWINPSEPMTDADVATWYNSGDGTNSSLFAAPDTTPPVVVIGVNNTSPIQNDDIDISFNVTDDTQPTFANITINWTTGTEIINYTLTGDTDLNNVSTITDIVGTVLEILGCAEDAELNSACVSKEVIVSDDVFPIINSSFNISSDNIFVYDILNISFNITDNLALSSANISINFTGFESYVANYSITGTGVIIFNVTQFNSGGVYNVTGYATDSSNNVAQNSTLLIIQDNVFPVVNQSSNASLDHLHISEMINFSANMTDETGLLFGNMTHNMTGDIAYINFTVSGKEAEVHNVTEITVVGESVINVTFYATDTSNQVTQNSTIYNVENTNPTDTTIILPTSDDYNNTQPDYPFEVTFADDVDGDPLTIYYYIDGVLNQTSATNTTFNASDGYYQLNVSIVDTHGDSSPNNASVNFTIDTTVPTLLVFNLTNNTRFGYQNGSINITIQDSNPYNLSYTLHDKSIDNIYSEHNDIQNTSTTIMLIPNLNLSQLASGNYTQDVNFSDRHTKNKIKDYKVTKHADSLDFITAEGSEVTIKQKQGSFPWGLKSVKKKDRYTIEFGATEYRETRVYEITSNKDIHIVENSRYKGHLIIGRNWMDFENDDPESVVTVKRKGKKVEVIVYSKDFNFKSIGGLNAVDVFYNFQVDNDPPSYPLNSTDSVTPIVSQNVELSVVCSDIIALSTCIIAHNDTGEWNNVSNVTMADSITNEVNHSISLTVTATAGNVIGFRASANDTFNEFSESEVLQTMQVNDTTSPTIVSGLNVTRYLINTTVNATFNVTDNFEVANGRIMIWELDEIRIFNFTLSGTTDEFSQNFTVSHLNVPGGVVNVTGWVNDTFQNSAETTTSRSITKDVYIRAKNVYDNTTITNFTATLYNDTFTSTLVSTSGLLNFSDIIEGDYNLNISADKDGGGYLNISYSFDAADNTIGYLPQAIVYINATRRGTSVGVNSFNVTVPKLDNESNATGGLRLLLNASNYEASVKSEDYFDTVLRMNLSNKSISRYTAEPYDINISVEVYSISDSTSVGNFTGIVSGNGSGFTESEFVNEGNATYSLGNNTYTIDITPELHSAVSFTGFFGSNNTFPNITLFVMGLNSINLTIFDELTEALIPENATMVITGLTSAQNLTITGGSGYIQDLEIGDNRLTFSTPTYTERDHYITIVNGSNSSVTLYLLSTTNGTDVTFTVQDNSGNPLENSELELKRYYVSTNSYRTIAMSRTNFEGQSIIDTDFNDAFYETFTTFDDFSQKTVGARMIATTFFITLNLLADPFQVIDAVDDVTSSISFNNLTETFSYTYSVLGGTDRKGTIEVYKITPTDKVLVCDNSDTSSGATILCQYNTTADEGTYIAEGSIQSGGQSILDKTVEVVTGFRNEVRTTFGAQGMFYTVLIMGTLAGLGAFVSPAIAILMFLIGLGISVVLGFTMMNITIYIAIFIMGAVIMYKMKS